MSMMGRRKTMNRVIKTALVTLSCAAGSAVGHDHDQVSDQPEALAMFALLMLSVLISTVAVSFQQSKSQKAGLALAAASEDISKTS